MAFKIGSITYQLQAKRSNLASFTTAEDPIGHVQHAAGGGDWFQRAVVASMSEATLMLQEDAPAGSGAGVLGCVEEV